MRLSDFNLRERQVFHGARAQFLYELIGWRFRNAVDLRFMNYGYESGDGPALRPEDESERFCAQLYHAVASQVPLAGARVLDVGSGRGGGASYVHRYLGPTETVGCDLAHQAIAFCNRVHGDVQGLRFQQGNAMELPFSSEFFDAVLNVESAHCYPDRARFFTEVFRVLRPGGHFLFTDFTPPRVPPAEDLATTMAALKDAGFAVPVVTDITEGIIRGLDRDDARRVREIRRHFPFGTRSLARLWAGTKGSWIYRDFVEGRRAYLMFRIAKPAPAQPARAPAQGRATALELQDTKTAPATQKASAIGV